MSWAAVNWCPKGIYESYEVRRKARETAENIVHIDIINEIAKCPQCGEERIIRDRFLSERFARAVCFICPCGIKIYAENGTPAMLEKDFLAKQGISCAGDSPITIEID